MSMALFGYGEPFGRCRFKKKVDYAGLVQSMDEHRDNPSAIKHNMGGNVQQNYSAQIPSGMRQQVVDYQNNPDSETARNALFQKWNELSPNAAAGFVNQSVADAGNMQSLNTAEGMLAQIAQAYNMPANAFPVKRPEDGGDLFGMQ